MIDGHDNFHEELKKEIAYYKRQLDQSSGQGIRHDLTVTSLHHSLKQKNEAFAVLTLLQKEFNVTTPVETLFARTVKAICTNLGMNRSLILIPADKPDTYIISHWYGYPSNSFQESNSKKVHLPPGFLMSGTPVLVNRKTGTDDTIRQIQNLFSLNFFIGVPVIHDEKIVAIILTGRIVERPPFSAALDKGDIDSITAITGLINNVLQNKKSVELQLQKTEVEKENEIISAQRDMLERTLKELKTTQSQLIHSEKMASLGQLTAGIAHEIQNPLNFVNNFSEVSNELISEMVDEANKGNIEEVKSIAKDVQENLVKILHHGNKADEIVKGMLQHSRSSTTVKEAVNINKLTDEYFRLAYHGLRAKDKFFNATLTTDFDESIGAINIIPQDIGRVILNLVSNAFYAVSSRKSAFANTSADKYDPIVSIGTKKENDRVEICIKDNGNGIPPQVLDKIFQPFFTTKPTGQGTGLGLSLSYDIIKAHGGEIHVKTKEGEGTEFIITLPVRANTN